MDPMELSWSLLWSLVEPMEPCGALLEPYGANGTLMEPEPYGASYGTLWSPQGPYKGLKGPYKGLIRL